MKKWYNHIQVEKNKPFDKWRTPTAELEEKEDQWVEDQMENLLYN